MNRRAKYRARLAALARAQPREAAEEWKVYAAMWIKRCLAAEVKLRALEGTDD